MAFFKKWKNQSRHHKLSNESEFGTHMKILSNGPLVCDDDEDYNEDNGLTSYTVKYLGFTTINSARSEAATSQAIKSIISTHKATGKKLQRVILNISPEGIDVLDSLTRDNLLRVSIYKISYCATEASHNQVFAFVGAEDADHPIDEVLKCHAFLCPKRKIAHDVTLTVAKSFQSAYTIWQEIMKEKKLKETANKKSVTNNNLLIDFNTSDRTSELCEKDPRQLLQNTWISFEDDHSSAYNILVN